MTHRPSIRTVTAGLVIAGTALVAPIATAAGQSTHGVRPHGIANTWVPTQPMAGARRGQTQTLLPDGDVLVAGGGTAAAELYDPSTRSFTPTGRMSTARRRATATLLPDGQVLVAGGLTDDGRRQLASAELYDPSTGSWQPTGSMTVSRSGQTATLLPDGDVLVAGGGCTPGGAYCDIGSFLNTRRSAELYDPGTGTWQRTGAMDSGREYFTATLLGDGTVLVTGGFSSCDDDFCEDSPSSQLYNPATGTWSKTGSMAQTRERQTATLLADGDVLVAGGEVQDSDMGAPHPLLDVETYDPTTGTWQPAPDALRYHVDGAATTLRNGWVLLAGGRTRAAEVFQPDSGIWLSTGPMSVRRTPATPTLLRNGQVLVAGGGLDSAETYIARPGPLVTLDPDRLGFGTRQTGSTSPPLTFTITNHGDGALDVRGVDVTGSNPGDFRATNDCTDSVPPGGLCTVTVTFTPAKPGHRTAVVDVVDDAPGSPHRESLSGWGKGPGAWSPTRAMMQGRSHFALVPLKDGDALVAGGEADLVTQASAEIYHPTTGRFTATSPMATPRSYVGAARLQDGRVLVVGGLDDSVPLGTAEIYDPTPGTWSETAPMLGTGAGLTATLLRNFTVLVTGFQTGPAAQVYDPAADTWTATSTPIGVGQFGVAVRLHDGDVLAAAAGNAAAGLYDPASGTWRATGSLNTAREAAEAVLLPSGDVLVAGGRAPGAGPTLASAEVYNPAAGTWQLTPNSMSKPRQWFTLTVLPTGLVLAAGGCGDTCTKADTYATTDVFYTGDGYWFSGAPMTRARHGASGVMLRSGDLLVAGGGASCCRVVRSAELYTPTFATPHPSSGAVGSSFELRGSGFDAFERVRLEWDFKPLAGVRTNAVGRFDVPLTVPAGSLGRHYINASGRRSFASAQAVFVVTASGPAGRAASSS